MHKFLVCAYDSQDLAQTPEKFALSHDRETVTFRNSDSQRGKNDQSIINLDQATIVYIEINPAVFAGIK